MLNHASGNNQTIKQSNNHQKMQTIKFLLQKEFLQVFRNKTMVVLIVAMPIIQLVILANAANYEIKNINLHVIDRDLSTASQQLVGKFQASTYFNIVNSSFSTKVAMNDIEQDKADLFLDIPPNFERDLRVENVAKLQISANAINGQKAGLGVNYASAIIQDFNADIRTEWLDLTDKNAQPNIEIPFSNWFNPDLNYTNYMVPGILVILVTMIGMFLSAMNIVKEKEIGTIEQLNVTPIRKYQFVIGKLMPFWLIGLFEMGFGLFIGKLAFDIPIEGSLWLIFAFSAVYLWLILGLGLLVSTMTDTQQQAMFISWFFLVIFILMSGLFTPIESMPTWAQRITYFNPIAYFVDFMRSVMLKGSKFGAVQQHFVILGAYALAINILAILNYRKQN
jgi:ABC-2 type transport system permease protein